jgi:plastocyanin
MRTTTRILTYLLLLTAVGCFSSCSTPEERSMQIQQATVTKSHTILIQQMKFSPAELTVQEGDSITWINRDMVTHNVTEELNKEWASGDLPVGKKWSMVATKTADYFCTLHPVMKGRLVVK